MARDLIRRLDHWYDAGRSHGPQTLSAAWRALSEHVATVVRVTTPIGQVVGRLVDLDLCQGVTLALAADNGSVADASMAGRIAQIALGDVLSLEPAGATTHQRASDAPMQDRDIPRA